MISTTMREDLAERYIPVRKGLWWKIRVGDGTATYGMFYTRTGALNMCNMLTEAFCDGEFVGNTHSEKMRKELLDHKVFSVPDQDFDAFETLLSIPKKV